MGTKTKECDAKPNKGGRPNKFPTPELLQEAIDQYFDSLIDRDETGKIVSRDIPTISGLAYALDMSTEGVRHYSSKDGFSAIVKRAKQRVEIELERRLHLNSPTGSIFNLKCNFGWREDDQQKAGQNITVMVNNPHASD